MADTCRKDEQSVNNTAVSTTIIIESNSIPSKKNSSRAFSLCSKTLNLSVPSCSTDQQEDCHSCEYVFQKVKSSLSVNGRIGPKFGSPDFRSCVETSQLRR